MKKVCFLGKTKTELFFQKKMLVYVFSRFLQRIDNYVWIKWWPSEFRKPPVFRKVAFVKLFPPAWIITSENKFQLSPTFRGSFKRRVVVSPPTRLFYCRPIIKALLWGIVPQLNVGTQLSCLWWIITQSANVLVMPWQLAHQNNFNNILQNLYV